MLRGPDYHKTPEKQTQQAGISCSICCLPFYHADRLGPVFVIWNICQNKGKVTRKHVFAPNSIQIFTVDRTQESARIKMNLRFWFSGRNQWVTCFGKDGELCWTSPMISCPCFSKPRSWFSTRPDGGGGSSGNIRLFWRALPIVLGPSDFRDNFLQQETCVEPWKKRGDRAKEEDEITAGELLWLSARRAQWLKVNLEILHSLWLPGTFLFFFFFLSPLTSNIRLCPLPDGNQSPLLWMCCSLCGASAVWLSSASKASARKVSRRRRELKSSHQSEFHTRHTVLADSHRAHSASCGPFFKMAFSWRVKRMSNRHTGTVPLSCSFNLQHEAKIWYRVSIHFLELKHPIL